jgi:Zn-dependent hydrolases, including glyoxylases
MKTLIVCLGIAFALSCGLNAQPVKTIKISNDLELVQITKNIFIHVSNSTIAGFGRVSSNGMVYTNNSKAFLFDTPANDSITEVLYKYLTDSLKLTITGFIPNHWHVDCMGGLRFLQSHGVVSYANRLTIDLAHKHNLPVPEHGFTDSLVLRVGSKAFSCYYLGAAHTLDNIVVWIPDEKVLFAGCMAKSLGSANLGNTADGDLKSYPETIEKVLNKFSTARFVIPGHGAYGTVALLEHTLMLSRRAN